MTSPKLNVSEIDLHAYVDGRLSDERRQEVETFLTATPPAHEKVQAYQEQNRLLHELFDSVLTEPVPDKWQRPGKTWSFFLRPVAASLAWMVLGAGIGWILHGEYPGVSPVNLDFARSAAMAHAVYSPEVRHPVEVTAEQEQHLVNWLSKRLGDPLKVPHLMDLGYELVGGRLLPGNQGPVAQFMYQNKNGQRLTLYIKTDSSAERETAFQFAQEGKIGVFYWIDRRLSYALSGEVEKPELLKVANAIYRKLNP
ncbi:MAG TPA: anti-sigma factor [Terriglobales bacterium]|nr:anti-sigma factor [Terriglobales bacterium]